jgi:hypothetical protein
VSKTRIHLVVTPEGRRLIKAGTKNAAIRHAARDLIKCSVASQGELVELVSTGTKVEDAAEPADEAEASE